ncbi:MAG: DUF2062 domain-containing protein, partial [Polyangiaceae bacterium]|nr:DUF2062 domain-containing protein [Polyangiaceae bacterium]
PLRLDVVVAYLAANISNPLVAPFLLTLEIETGSLLLTGELVPADIERFRATGLAGLALEGVLGSVIVGLTLASMGAALTAALVGRRRTEPDELEQATVRTLARYRDAPIGDRSYVAAKLGTDPIVAALHSLPGSFGVLLDAGAGRGQLSLLALELGRATHVVGFDWDTRKTGLAQRAARGEAHYFEADLRSVCWPPADTILMADVLHYLAPDDQDAVLERAAADLRPGGRLVIREVEEARGWRTVFTRASERIGSFVGYNQGRRLHFQPISRLVARLESLGLECTKVPAGTGPLSNVLLVAHRSSLGRTHCGQNNAATNKRPATGGARLQWLASSRDSTDTGR